LFIKISKGMLKIQTLSAIRFNSTKFFLILYSTFTNAYPNHEFKAITPENQFKRIV
jgi:hypothetical protein